MEIKKKKSYIRGNKCVWINKDIWLYDYEYIKFDLRKNVMNVMLIFWLFILNIVFRLS